MMNQDNILVAITASREEDEIVYKVECSSDLTTGEFEYYLTEIINGICKWRKDVCKDNVKSFKGKPKQKRKRKILSE